jgi:hypothetical protein
VDSEQRETERDREEREKRDTIGISLPMKAAADAFTCKAVRM